MNNRTSERDIFDLLSSLKNAETEYPSDLMQSRRELFATQVASAVIATHAMGKSPELSSASQSTAGMTGIGSSIGSLLETVLIIAILIEAGIATYIFRDKIADLISSIISPRVEQITSPPDASSSKIAPATEAKTTPSAPATVTVTTTPMPSITLPALPQNNNNDTGGGSQISSTPDPNGNNGLHLGQTKQPTNEPEATREPENNNSTNDSSNDNSAPNNKKNK